MLCRIRCKTGTKETNIRPPYAADPKYEEEVSGCTACVGLITDDKIFVVSFTRTKNNNSRLRNARPNLKCL